MNGRAVRKAAQGHSQEGREMRRIVTFALTAVMLLSVGAGCVKQKPLPPAEKEMKASDFQIGPEDVLEITVWRNTDLTRTVVVRPDGMISMPLIGDVRASGLTANQLAEQIAKRLKDYKENPTVAVSIKEVNSYNVYVLGEVAKPGKYQLKSYTTVLQAIAMAGGFTMYASKNKMQVVRNSVNGDGRLQEIRIPARYDDLLSGNGELGNFILKAADTVVVP
jgi:polysaccharide export outer membrane protein